MASKRRRRLFSAAESAEVWDRWQRGDGLKLIGRVFDRSSGAIFEHLRPHGGIRPVPRRRSRRVLSLAEREEISRGVAAGVSLRSIAGSLGRAASTISRELRRNGGHRYRAAAADQRAWDRALRPKLCKLARREELRQLVAARTWDRGKEMAEHKRFTLATDVAVYFCDPQSPWQRGSNENTNGLLRQYFPKGTNLSLHSQERLDEVARQLNGRPRKTLGFETPAERFAACVAMTD